MLRCLFVLALVLAGRPLSATPQAHRPRSPGTPLGTAEIVSAHALSPDGAWVAFVSDRDSSGTYELWGAPVDQSSPSLKLSGLLAAGGDVMTFPPIEISATNRVVYVARQGKDELYSVPVDGSAAPVKLNGPLVAGGNVQAFEIDPQGARVIYRADEDVNNRVELYSVPIDGSQAPVKLTPGGVAHAVADRISPDGTRVVYATGVTGASSVWSQPIDASAAAVLLGQVFLDNYPFSTDEDNLRPLFTPDSSQVVFRELQVTGGGSIAHPRLYSAPVDGSLAAIRLHPTDSVRSHFMTPDGARVLYLVSEVHSVPTTGGASYAVTDSPGTLARPEVPGIDQTGLSGRGRAVSGLFPSLDGSQLLVSTRRLPAFFASELHLVPIDGSTPPRRLVGPLASPLTLTQPVLATASARALYAVFNSSQDPELFSVPGDGSSLPVRLAKRLEQIGTEPPIWTLAPDQLRVAFCGEPDASGLAGLYVLPTDGSGSAVLLEELQSTATAYELSISSGSLFAVLRRSQSSGSGVQLVGAPLDGSTSAIPY